MTIHKLARLLVEEWYDGSPGSERALIAVEETERELERGAFNAGNGRVYVYVEVDGDSSTDRSE